MCMGTVSWFNSAKGIGAIRAEQGQEVFVRFSEIRDDGLRTLAQGESVRFEIRETDRGPVAANVVRK